MITVHHLNNSRSQRVLWLLEELGLPYEIVSYARNSKTIGRSLPFPAMYNQNGALKQRRG